MCGRFAIGLPPKSLAEHFELDHISEFTPRYNIAPTKYVPSISRDKADKGRKAVLRRWGFLPQWAKDISMGVRLINARSETVAEKPSFREAVKRRRCLVPASGFYEWRRAGKEKQAFYIKIKQEDILGFAGLWSTWRNADNEIIESFTILTTAANETMKTIHDRMPVILRPDDYQLWLDPEKTEPAEISHLLAPYPSVDMDFIPVSPFVNNVRNEGHGCIEPMNIME